jgi:hypothetical protein
MQHDFYIAGRWRNQETIKEITEAVRSQGYSAFCFLENDYTKTLEKLGLDERAMESNNTEQLPQDHPLIEAIFEKDMDGEKSSENFLLVLPAGIAGHIEAGIAYGMGKKCYAVGEVEKTETLYCIFDEIFPDVDALKRWLKSNKS